MDWQQSSGCNEALCFAAKIGLFSVGTNSDVRENGSISTSAETKGLSSTKSDAEQARTGGGIAGYEMQKPLKNQGFWLVKLPRMDSNHE